MSNAVTVNMTVDSLAYDSAIDLLAETEGEHVIGEMIVFSTTSPCGRPSIVVINQLDTRGCMLIKL